MPSATRAPQRGEPIVKNRPWPPQNFLIRRIVMNNNVECPLCEASVALGIDTVLDELVECMDCGTELVVTSMNPLRLEEAPHAEEDWGQ